VFIIVYNTGLLFALLNLLRIQFSQVKSSQVAFNVVKVTNAQSYNITMQI